MSDENPNIGVIVYETGSAVSACDTKFPVWLAPIAGALNDTAAKGRVVWILLK